MIAPGAIQTNSLVDQLAQVVDLSLRCCLKGLFLKISVGFEGLFQGLPLFVTDGTHI